MRCFVCDAEMTPFLRKDFAGHHGLGEVDYVRCRACWLVVSQTHYEMDDAAWERLNEAYHEYLGTGANADDPNWLPRLHAQAEALAAVGDADITPDEVAWLDYGAGDGTLSQLLAEHGWVMLNYDKYLPQEGFLGEEELVDDGFGLVLTTSVYEHIRGLETLEEVERLVAPGGAQAFHTSVLTEIPRDPSWHYLLPVHTTFFTYRSLELLMERWGYRSSAYAPGTGMWWLFRSDATHLEERLPGAFAVGPGLVREP